MGTKYIVEVEDKPFELLSKDGFTSEKLFRVKGFNSLVFDWNGLNKLTPYTEPDLEQVRKKAYDEGYEDAEEKYNDGYSDGYDAGLDDAWETARKIVNCAIPYEALENYLEIGECTADVIKHLPASKAIEVVRQYEQEKEEQIQVGDEVRNIQHGWTAVVSAIDRECMTLMDTNGKLGDGYDMNRFIKTGRHFPEIATILEKMRGEQDG